MNRRPTSTSKVPSGQGKWSSCFDKITEVLFNILSFSYSGSLKYHTIDPLDKIHENQDYEKDLPAVVKVLADFRQIKNKELDFVQKAVSENHLFSSGLS